MRPRFAVRATVLCLMCLAGAAPSRGDDYFVPSVWSLQDAIDDAADNASPENRILLDASPVAGNFTIGPDFDAAHTLFIGPDGDAGLGRATLLASAMNAPILTLHGAMGSGAGYVTIEDLDVLRKDSGSASDLVFVDSMVHVTIDRCRIGLDMQAPTSAGYSNLKILYPIDVVVRNCLFFSSRPGGLDRAVNVQNMIDAASSILLYNNLAADYRLQGYFVSDGGSNPGALVLLRNNVAVNSLAVTPEPFGYRSEVDDATVVTSHNVVFATPGFEESLMAGAVSIGGGAAASSISMLRATAIISFVTTTWTPTPPYDANPTFFRLLGAGPLHDAATDWGQTVEDGAPHARDVAVLQDFDRQGRPGGIPAHTDRGPDQIEAAAATGVATQPDADAAGVLFVTARPNPSSRILLHFAAKEAGVLSLEVFDIRGRRIAREERLVAAGEGGRWNAVPRPVGVAFYRATLRTVEGREFSAAGKVTLLK